MDEAVLDRALPCQPSVSTFIQFFYQILDGHVARRFSIEMDKKLYSVMVFALCQRYSHLRMSSALASSDVGHFRFAHTLLPHIRRHNKSPLPRSHQHVLELVSLNSRRGLHTAIGHAKDCLPQHLRRPSIQHYALRTCALKHVNQPPVLP